MYRSLLVLVAFSAATLFAADKPVRLSVKTGLWESTTVVTTSGQMPIPPEMLSRMSPEQRARMEERIKANSGEHSTTYVDKHCLTPKELDEGFHLGGTPEGAECTETILTSTPTKARVKMSCTMEGIRGSGIMAVEALSPESVKGSGDINVEDSEHAMKSHTSFTSKWLGSACGKTR